MTARSISQHSPVTEQDEGGLSFAFALFFAQLYRLKQVFLVMKRFLLSIWLLLVLTVPMQAQECEPQIGSAPWFSAPLPSVLELMTGDFPLPSAEYLGKMGQGRPGLDAFDWLDYQLAAGKSETVVNYASADANFSTPDLLMRGRIYAGIAHLQTRKYTNAAAAFASAMADSCGSGTANRLRIAAVYLQKYEPKGDAPLFSHFNGGFSNFLSDSLEGSIQEKSVELGLALEELLQVHRLLGGKQRAIAELVGDLVLNSPDAFLGRWTAAISYLSAGDGLKGADSTAYDRKAIYCLESDRMNPKYFNAYRFKKLVKNFALDSDSAAARQIAFTSHEADWLASAQPAQTIDQFYPGYSKAGTTLNMLPERSSSVLTEQIIREQERSMKVGAGPNPNANPLNPDIDVDGIKRNPTYNFYAIGLILAVIGAGVFMAWQLKKHAKTR